jgi:hypothetical protein
MGLTAELLVRLTATQTGSNDFGGPAFTPRVEKRLQFESGTAAGQADILWVDERTVASGANDDIDLAGVLTGAFGASIVAAELVALLVINGPRSEGSVNTTALTIGDAASNPIAGFLGGTDPTIGPIQPGGFVALGAGHASGLGVVTGGAADVLRIANAAGAAATYQIAVLARSA